MLNNNPPLSIATTVLTDDTIEAVRHSPSFHARAWQILDRWALNSPVALCRMEREGEIILLERLLIQQDLEHQTLRSEEGLNHQRHGLTEHEILCPAWHLRQPLNWLRFWGLGACPEQGGRSRRECNDCSRAIAISPFTAV